MADYTNVPIAAAGDWIDDAYLNTYLGDNLRAVFGALTGAGQLLASTAANRLTKVAVTGHTGYVLQEDTTLPEKMKFGAAPESLPAGGSAYQGLRIGSGGSIKEWAALLSLLGRQGGSTTNWSSTGTTNYTPGAAIIQAGSLVAWSGTAVENLTTSFTLNFPVAFSQVPVVICDFSSGIADVVTYARTSITTTGVTISLNMKTQAGFPFGGPIVLSWMAIGAP